MRELVVDLYHGDICSSSLRHSQESYTMIALLTRVQATFIRYEYDIPSTIEDLHTKMYELRRVSTSCDDMCVGSGDICTSLVRLTTRNGRVVLTYGEIGINTGSFACSDHISTL